MKDYIKAKIRHLKNADYNEVTKAIEVIKLPDNFLLQKVPAPRYWQAKEPVVLMTGKAIQPAKRYGGDGEYRSDNTLACRLFSQLNTTVTVNLVSPAYTIKPLEYLSLCNIEPKAALVNGIIADLVLQDALFIYLAASKNDFPKRIDIAAAIKDYILVPDASSIDSALFPSEMKTQLDYYYKNHNVNIASKIKQKNWEKDLHYYIISNNLQDKSKLSYDGIAMAPVAWNDWENNPWLPFYFKWQADYAACNNFLQNEQLNIDFLKSGYEQKADNFELSLQKSTQFQTPYTYSNRFVLSPHAKQQMMYHLENELTCLAENERLKSSLLSLWQSSENIEDTLSQSLFGLNEEFLQMSNAMQFIVADYNSPGSEKDFSNKLVRDAVAVITQHKLNFDKDNSRYFPIRAGLLKINQLTLIDTFGRNVSFEIKNLIVANSLRTNIPGKDKDNGYIQLTPRFVQPTRLICRWIVANGRFFNQLPATNPVYAYLLPNFLDKAVWIYDGKGTAIGAFELNDAENDMVWLPVPNSGTATVFETFAQFQNTDQYKHLEEQVKKLLSFLNNVSNFKGFLQNIEQSITLSQPAAYRQFFGISFFLGTPVAVADAQLQFDMAGLPARCYSESTLKDEMRLDDEKVNDPYNSTLGFEKVKIPVTLGKQQHSGDGLLAISLKKDFTDVQYINQAQDISLTAETPLKVSLFFDPRNKISIRTNVLPVENMSLPPYIYSDALDKMQLAFEIAPMLTNENQIAMPLPDVGGVTWDWLDVNNDVYQTTENIKTPPAEFSETEFNELREGWIKIHTK